MPSQRNAGIPAAEWAVAAVGALVVLLTATYLLYETIWGDSSPPRLSVAVQTIERQPDGYLVLVRIRNSGGSAAASVVVTGSVDEEVSELTVDYVAAHSQAAGGLFFRRDPRGGKLRLEARSYAAP